MVVRPPWELTTAEVRERVIRRARLLLVVGHGRGRRTVVLDADTGGFVGIPGRPRGPETEALSLSPDGTHVVFRAGSRWRSARRLVVHTLATGEQRTFDARADGLDRQAVLSPDGFSLATLGDLDDDVLVSTLDIRTGTRRRLWSTEGMSILSGWLGWSPDGRRLAVTYDTHDADGRTVVIDARDGRLVSRHEGMMALPGANGGWLGPDELLLTPDEFDTDTPPVFLARPDTGGVDRYDPELAWLDRLAAVDGRVIQRENIDPDVAGVRLVSTELDGTDPRPFLTIGPGPGLVLFDHAPRSGAWSA